MCPIALMLLTPVIEPVFNSILSTSVITPSLRSKLVNVAAVPLTEDAVISLTTMSGVSVKLLAVLAIPINPVAPSALMFPLTVISCGSLSLLRVPEEMLEAFKVVRFSPTPENPAAVIIPEALTSP